MTVLQGGEVAETAVEGLTEEQMEVLWRHHPEPTLCFDGDRAVATGGGDLDPGRR